MSRIISAHKVSEIISNISKDIKQENVMNDKIQMTEEQARELYERCIYDDSITTEKLFIMNLSGNGYIIKSELQQKVEEAEEKHKAWFKREQLSNEFDCYHITCLYDIIQLLKQSHPEFKEK